jgi:hypothetical protein
MNPKTTPRSSPGLALQLHPVDPLWVIWSGWEGGDVWCFGRGIAGPVGGRAARRRGAAVRPLFARPSVAGSAAAFLDGPLGPERRETGWMRAEAARVIRVPGVSRPCWGAAAGRSRTPSRRRRPTSVSTTTRRAAGTVGTATSRWSCSPSPCWRCSATGRTPPRHPQEAPPPPSGAAHGVLVRPGDPAARAPSGSAPDRARLRHRLVRLAKLPPSHGPTSPSQANRATVMLCQSVAAAGAAPEAAVTRAFGGGGEPRVRSR